MINVSETQRYKIRPKRIIFDSFDTAFSKFVETLPAAPPSKASLAFSVLSMLLLIFMFILTAVKYNDESTIWYGLALVCVFFAARFIYKYMNAYKEYMKSAGRPSSRQKKKDDFMHLFYNDKEEIPESLTTTEMLSKVSPLIGRQADASINAALRDMAESLAAVNNPAYPLCKLITPFGDVFNQVKRRFYMLPDEDDIVFLDDDWQNPKGEIVCSRDEVVSFGTFSKYPASINSAGGGKIKPDAIIVEIQDDTNHLYFEFHPRDYSQVKKILSTKKELK